MTPLEKLRALCGFIQNSSDVPVTISQDDASYAWVVRVGKRGSYAHETLEGAIDGAYEKWGTE